MFYEALTWYLLRRLKENHENSWQDRQPESEDRNLDISYTKYEFLKMFRDVKHFCGVGMGMKQYKNGVDWRAVALATRDLPVL